MSICLHLAKLCLKCEVLYIKLCLSLLLLVKSASRGAKSEILFCINFTASVFLEAICLELQSDPHLHFVLALY